MAEHDYPGQTTEAGTINAEIAEGSDFCNRRLVRRKRLLRFLLPIAAALLLAASVIFLRHPIAYSYARWRFNRQEYSTAKQAFEALDGFADSEGYLNNIDFISALHAMKAGQYQSAIDLFRSIDGYAVKNALIRQCHTLMGDDFLAAGDYAKALGCYTKSQNDAGIKKARISWGDRLFEGKDYTSAINQWKRCAAEQGVEARILRAEYELACIAAEAGNDYAAVILLNNLGYDERAAEAVVKLLPLDKKDTRTLAVGGNHIVYLAYDGSVRADGSNSHGQCEVEDWTGVVSLCASERNTYGLVFDGTVLAAGSDAYQQLNTAAWTNIISLCAADNAVFGLMSDGTVVFSGGAAGQYDAVRDWKFIRAIDAGKEHIAAVGQYGSVYAAGNPAYGQCALSGIENAARVICGPYSTIILSDDGSSVVCGACPSALKSAVSSWTDMKDARASHAHIVAVDSSGNFHAAGQNARGQCGVSAWTDIALFEVGRDFTIAVKKDGSVVVTVAGHALDWQVMVWS